MPVTTALSFRASTLDDAELIADMLTAREPESPWDPLELRHWWASQDPEWTNRRFVAELDGRPIGGAYMSHAPWEKRPQLVADVGAWFAPPHEVAANLDRGYDMVEDLARRDGARSFRTGTRESRHDLLAYLSGRGYHEDRRGKRWELDLVAQRDRLLSMLEASRAKMREQGIEIHTIDRDRDPDVYRKLHAMSEAAVQDVPTTIPHLPEPFEQFMKWFDSPGIHRARMWIARKGDDVVGTSALSYPKVRGYVGTDWTATARAVRGRGVARALKLETLRQAMDLGVAKVRTGNDAQNAPILHLNEVMGYAPQPEEIQLMREAD